MLPAPRHVGALCAVSWGAVVLELAYGRMLSVALAPYFAATVITLAVIGRGAGAWLVHALPGACRADAFDRQLTTTMGLLSIAAILSEVMFLEHLWLPQTLSVRGLVLLTAMTAVMAVPAFLSGIAAALVMVHGTPRIERLFGARYAGMALGFVTAVAAGSLIPTPFVPPLVAAIVGWAALIVAADAGTSPRVPATACTIAFLFGLIASSNPRVFRMLQVRQWAQPYTETEAWSADTRIGVFRAGSDTTAAQTLPLARLPGDYTAPPPPAFKWIDVDASNWQPLLQFDGNLEPLAFLRDSVVYAAHHLRAPASVLLVGVGGGRDILAAKAFAQPRIVGLEASALMRDTVERRYDYLSGRPYDLPGVEVSVGDLRGALARRDDTFDIVQIGTASTGTLGCLQPSGNYLLTREAIAEYRRHLNSRGLLSITLPFLPEYPFELLRLTRTVREVWAVQGAVDPGQHIVVLMQDFSATLLAQPEPFADVDLGRVDALATAKRMRVVYDPRRRTATTDDALLLLGPEGLPVLQVGVSLRPASDDHPFFRQFLRSPLQHLTPDPFGIVTEARDGLRVGFLLFAITTALALVGTIVPTGTPALPRSLLLACASLGFGFVMLQIPLLQWLTLLLGSSARALMIGASSFFFAAAIGALAGQRVGAYRHGATIAAATAAALVSVYAIALPRVVAMWLPGSPAATVMVTMLLVTPLGVLLGLTHPQAIAALDRHAPGRVAWGLGLEVVAGASALASVAILASQAGYTVTMLVGATAYAVASVAFLTAARGSTAAG